jgi:putative ABC transport system permease protein
LRNSPTFTVIGILSLALGIGITSAVFSVADALLLRPLPVPRSSEIATISSTAPGVRAAAGAVSYRDYADLRDQNKSFQGLIAFAYLRAGIAANPTAPPQVKEVLAVSGNYFRVFEVEPALGRGFSSEEDRVPGRNAVAVLSYTTWEQAFSADPKVIGRTIRLNDREFTIIGVAPRTFIGTDASIHPDLYIPIMMLPQVTAWGGSAISQRDSRSFTVKGRLKPGTSLAQAAAEMDTLGRRLAGAYPDTNRNRGLLVRTELQARAAQAPQRLALSAMLLGIAGLVLLVACANVASLLLGRAAVRSREMAVRLAVGARPSRLVRQLLTESLLLALAGGALGLLLAKFGVSYIASVVSFSTDLPQYLSFRLDQRVLAFNFVVAVMSALAFGLAPAIRGARTDLVSSLKTGPGNGSGGRTGIRSALVVGQVALALMLLSGEALFIRTFQSMGLASPGFRTDHLAMMSFDPSLVRYTSEQTGKFYRTLIERARGLPGVNHAALSRMTPTEFIPPSASVAPEGFKFPPDRENDSVYTYTVGDQYFETIGTPLVSGRGFRVTDDSTAPRVAVINEVFAEKYWPGVNPVGKRFRLGDRTGPWVEVVGVAKTTWYAFVGEDRAPFFYLPMAQNPQVAMTLMVETATPDAAGAIGPLRHLVHSIDGRQPVFNVRTMSEYYPRQSLQALRLVVQLVGTMGLLGLSLALIGIYALVAYSVSRRTHEIGIRMAIGAGRLDILRLVLGQGLTLALVGAGLGLAGSVGMIRGIRTLFTRLQERGIFDAWTFVAVPLALIAVAVVASYIPARRAAAIDPNRALHYE